MDGMPTADGPCSPAVWLEECRISNICDGPCGVVVVVVVVVVVWGGRGWEGGRRVQLGAGDGQTL